MDHLLSMELLLIENNRLKPSGLGSSVCKRFLEKATDFLLGFERLFLSIDFVL